MFICNMMLQDDPGLQPQRGNKQQCLSQVREAQTWAQPLN